MTLRIVRTDNYRSFLGPTELELRPLTLLFGHNNAGKSSLVRLLPLLAESVGPGAAGPLALSCAALRGARFRDLACRISGVPEVGLELRWEAPPGPAGGVASYGCRVRDMPEHRAQIVERFWVGGQDGGRRVEALWRPEPGSGNGLSRTYDVEAQGTRAEAVPFGFEGLVPVLADAEGTPRAAWAADVAEARRLLRSFGGGVQWVASLRRAPPRTEPYLAQRPARLDPWGEDACQLLDFDRLDGGSLVEDVSAWYERHFRQRLAMREPAPDHLEATLSPVERPALRVNLADTGEGMAQVLPVLLACALARRRTPSAPRILALEQPELHLHPAAHEHLASHLCELAAEDDPPRIVVETHSENLLLGVQVAVAAGKLRAERVGVYWVRQLEDGRSLAEPITIDDEGRPSDGWPPGVFSEDSVLARELYRLRRERDA